MVVSGCFHAPAALLPSIVVPVRTVRRHDPVSYPCRGHKTPPGMFTLLPGHYTTEVQQGGPRGNGKTNLVLSGIERRPPNKQAKQCPSR
jgi:hypothetical protein